MTKLLVGRGKAREQRGFLRRLGQIGIRDPGCLRRVEWVCVRKCLFAIGNDCAGNGRGDRRAWRSEILPRRGGRGNSMLEFGCGP